MLNVQVGDKVIRYLVGTIKQELKVTDVTPEIIVCGGNATEHTGWWFDRKTGAEIDEDLDWGPPPKMTGSYIVLATSEN